MKLGELRPAAEKLQERELDVELVLELEKHQEKDIKDKKQEVVEE